MARGRKKARRNPKPQNDQEDRLSTLPDALLHQIHSKLDIVYAVQACKFSIRWRNLWKTLTHVNFDRRHFQRMADFHKYVFEFLSHRDSNSDLSVVSLRSTYGAIEWSLLTKVALYAAAHNVQSLDVFSFFTRRQPCIQCEGVIPLPMSVFSCDSLKELNLRARNLRLTNVRGESCWMLPALTTLTLANVSLEFCCDEHSTKFVNVLSRLVNLKNLTMIGCSTRGLIKFKIINCPALESLVIDNNHVSELCEFVVSAPKLSSFTYKGREGVPLSTSNLHCLKDLWIDLDGFCVNATYAQRHSAGKKIFKMLKQLQAAEFVVLSKYTVELLWLILYTVENQPSPLINLNHLTAEGPGYCNTESDLIDRVLSYLCSSSPFNPTVDVDGELRAFNLEDESDEDFEDDGS